MSSRKLFNNVSALRLTALIAMLAVAGLALVGCSSSGIKVDITADNMSPTLRSGSSVTFTRASHGFQPKPGDIVLFKGQSRWEQNPKARAVQRAVATGGQTIRGFVKDGKNIVQVRDAGAADFRTLDEPYVMDDGFHTGAVFGPVEVPAGRLFLMGDHRSVSADSRYHCLNDSNCDPMFSTIPSDDVIGYVRR